MDTPNLNEAVNRQPHPMTDNSKALRELAALKHDLQVMRDRARWQECNASYRRALERIAFAITGDEELSIPPTEPDAMVSWRQMILSRLARRLEGK